VQDDDDNFAATGIASGSKNRMDVLQTNALTNAQNIVRQKMQHAYKGAIDDYSNSIGDNSGTDMTAKVERAGTQIINGIVNNTKAVCGPKFSSVDAKGDVNCYIAIRISNKQVIEAVANHLSNDKELKIRFDEENFRKKMEANFEKFKEQK
jgi:predicted Zn-dependent protease